MSQPAGKRWRILAQGTKGERISLESPPVASATKRFRAAHPEVNWAGVANIVGPEPTAPDSVFDELVIDDWFHLEQMDTRLWWMRVGDYHLWVRIPAKGDPIVTHNGQELETYGLGRDR